MSIEENKEVVRRFADEVFNRGNLGVADELLVEDYRQHSIMGLPQGREGFKQFFAGFGQAVSDGEYTIHDLIAEGDKVVLYGTFSATHTGEMQGIPATGRHFDLTAIDIFRLEDGKIVEHWDVVNQMGMLQQLGVIPAPE